MQLKMINKKGDTKDNREKWREKKINKRVSMNKQITS